MKATFLDKLLGRMDRIDPASLQNYVLRLAREKGILETIFNTIREGVIVTDADGRIRYLNRAAGELLGVDPVQAAGEFITAYLHDVDWDKIGGAAPEDWQKIVAREFEVFYPQHRFLNFYVLPIEPEAAAASADTDKPGFVAILSNVTEMRQKTTATIESERLNALTMLAATVAHELGNPLNSLTIHLQLLERELKKLPVAKRKKLEENLGVALDEIARLDHIITSFLRAMRPSRPRLQLANVNELVAETLEVIRPELDDRGIVVRQRSGGKLPRVPLDATQIKQAFFNVIKNALQSMPSGGVLTIGTEVTDTHVVVSFSDVGSGIPQKEIGRIFQPFHTTKSTGSGLGLMIVHRIVREHGGELELETAEGAGTTVRIRLLIHPRRVKLLEAPQRPVERAAESVEREA
jgi:PAS domain S-box-containing protein